MDISNGNGKGRVYAFVVDGISNFSAYTNIFEKVMEIGPQTKRQRLSMNSLPSIITTRCYSCLFFHNCCSHETGH